MQVVYQSFIAREDLKANRDVLYVFGDNVARVGFGGQARECRGEVNAVGIATKLSPQKSFTELTEEFKLYVRLDIEHLKALTRDYNTKVLVFPRDGIGTGLANLPKDCREFLDEELSKLGIRNGVHE